MLQWRLGFIALTTVSDQKTRPSSEESKPHLEGQKPPDNIDIFQGAGCIFLRNNALDDCPITLNLFLFYDKIIDTKKYILAK